jgi:hypothetical protein
VHSEEVCSLVIPAEAGIQAIFDVERTNLDAGFHRMTDSGFGYNKKG